MSPLLVSVTLTFLGVTAVSSFCPDNFPCRCDDRPQPVGRQIQCSGLRLETLPNFTAIGQVRIGRIDLVFNKISTIPDGAFDGVNVEEILLSVNPLKTVGANAFQGVKNLTALHLDNAELTEFPPVFKTCPQLKALHLADNKITTLSRKHFKLAKTLQTLVLDRNQVTDISDKVFEYVSDTLEVLGLVGMNLIHVPGAVAELSKLRKLDLRQNKITELSQIFTVKYRGDKSANIEYDFTSNRIATVDPIAFENRPVPARIALSKNLLRNLSFLNDYCDFENTVVDVSENPIECDCSLYRVIRSQLPNIYGKCRAPANFTDLKLGTTWEDTHFRKMAAKVCGDQLPVMRYDCACAVWRYEALYSRDWGECKSSYNPVADDNESSIDGSGSGNIYSCIFLVLISAMIGILPW